MENPFQSPTKVPSVPGTPLQQLSPDRLNQRMPNSPSLPTTLEQGTRRQSHRLSDAADVKARVAMLNSMSHHGSPTKPVSPSKSYAAIQRAIMGREEAETALNTINAQLESAKARERLVAERVESLMEQLQDARNRQRHERQVYEKEIKIAKKNEYKAELVVIKLQEELKELRNELEGHKVRGDHDRIEKEKARQEAFERAYTVAGLTEEMQTLKEQLKAAEQERDNAVATAVSKMPLKHSVESSSRGIQTEPISNNEERGKRKKPTPSFDSGANLAFVDDMDLDDENCSLEIRHAALQREVKWLRMQHKEGQEQIHFMNMQCQFHACPCRVAERRGVRFVHDYEYDQKLRVQNAKRQKLENEKPLPRYASWKGRVERQMAKQIMMTGTDVQHEEPCAESMEVDVETGPIKASRQPQSMPVAPLPPTDIKVDESQNSELVIEAEEAAQVPLPTSGEDTAQLEDFTQVLIEPATTTGQTFSFTASTSGQNSRSPMALNKQQSKNTIDLPDDFFNLSPPKRTPARPSTAMGLLTTGSPIRLVPGSPQPASAQPRAQYTEISSQTTRVALNDASSSARVGRPRQRSQSRPNVKESTSLRGRSPPGQSNIGTSRPASALSMLDSVSPASVTMFAITPIAKHARGNPHTRTQNHPRTQTVQHDTADNGLQHDATQTCNMLSETTTTTTIPLKSEDTEFTMFTTSQRSNDDVSSAAAITHATYLKDNFNVPGTPITREAALAQIRARRDRARSVNMRKPSDQQQHPDGGERPSKGMKTPGSVARRGIKLDLGSRLGLNNNSGDSERGRDVSHASAPGRF